MGKIKQIQGVRAIAILCVFVSHTSHLMFTNGSKFWEFERLGSAAVYTFFILSGFLIAYKGVVINQSRITDAIRLGYRKVSKLYVLHLLMLLTTFFCFYPDTTKQWTSYLISFPFNVSLTQSLIPLVGIVNSYNGPSWFLSSYLWMWIVIYLFPSITNNLQTSSLRGVVVIFCSIIVLQLAYRYLLTVFPWELIPHRYDAFYGWFWYHSPFLCFSEFLLGCCLGRFVTICRINDLLKAVLQVLSLLLACICMKLLSFHDIAFQILMEMVVMIGIASVIDTRALGGAFLSNRLLTYIGDLSPYIFLIHAPVSYLLVRFEWLVSRVPLPFFITLLTSLAFSALAATINKRLETLMKKQ